MDVLLTGGAGLVGQAILRVLREDDSPWRVLAPRSRELNLLDQAAVENWFVAHKPDLVLHAAAVVGGIQANIDNPTRFLADNLLINTLVIEGARRAGVRNLMFVGSSCMYPRDFEIPLKEEHMLTAPLEPTNEGYAISKIAGARHCEAIATEFGLNYRTIVPCNLYGPDDHFDPMRGHLVGAAIYKVHQAKLSGTPEVEIWGDGSARREFLYVDDLARFIVAWAPKLAQLPPMINVGVGEDRTVNEYYAAAAEVIQYRGAFKHNLSAPTGMRRKLMDVSKAHALGWRAQTDIAEGMRLSYQGMLARTSGAS